MIIAIDAMGGDFAPKAVVEGALLALQETGEDVCLSLYGDEAQIRACLEGQSYDGGRLKIVPCTEVISCEEAPAAAVRQKKDSSMVRAAQAVAQGEADCFLSGGSSGAVLTAGTLIIRRIKGIQRPALATLIPNMQGGYTMLVDSGANADCKSAYLVQFAHMGAAYMQQVMGVEDPRIGLLNNGAEAEKGNELTKETYALLEQEPGIRFAGNAEARELMSGDFDVLVADGFSGNVLLKGTEGAAKAITAMLKTELMGTLRGSAGGRHCQACLCGPEKAHGLQRGGGRAFAGGQRRRYQGSRQFRRAGLQKRYSAGGEAGAGFRYGADRPGLSLKIRLKRQKQVDIALRLH